MSSTPLTSVGLAVDQGFFQPPTNNPLTSDGNIGLAPRTIIEPGTVTFPAAITFNQFGQIIGAVSGEGESVNGLLAQSAVADYGKVVVPTGNTSSLVNFTTSALQNSSCILIQPISNTNTGCGIAGICPTPDRFNDTGASNTASSVVTVVIPQTNNPITSFYWAVINPIKTIASYVHPAGMFTLKGINGLRTNINCADYGIPNLSLSAYFLSVSAPTSNAPVYASLIATDPNTNTISIFTTGQCDVTVLVISTFRSLSTISNCILLNGGNITAPGSTVINDTSCFEVPSLTTSSKGFISCFTSLVVPTTAVSSICGIVINGGSTPDPSSWMQTGKGQINSTYAYPSSSASNVPLLGMCYINVFQSIGE